MIHIKIQELAVVLDSMPATLEGLFVNGEFIGKVVTCGGPGDDEQWKSFLRAHWVRVQVHEDGTTSVLERVLPTEG